MRKKAAMRLFLPFPFALAGMVLGIFAAPILLAAGCPPGSAMGVGVRSMLVGSMLGSLCGCAAAVPLDAISTGRRILSFVLAPAVAILGMYAYCSLVGDVPSQYDWTFLLITFLLVIPGLSLFGFAVPVLLSPKKTG